MLYICSAEAPIKGASQAPFVKEVERLGPAWAFTLKENQPALLREAEELTPESPSGVHAEPGREIRYWHLPEADWLSPIVWYES